MWAKGHMPQPISKPIWHTAIEYAPSLAFLVVYLISENMRIAGWTGTGFAAFACCAYAWGKLSPHSLFLGINIYLLYITATIEALYALDLDAAGDALNMNAQPLLFFSILVTGCVLAAASKTGFLNIPAETTYRPDKTI